MGRGPSGLGPPHPSSRRVTTLPPTNAVTLLGKATDRAGRPGFAVSQTTDYSRRELLFDPDTSELLAEHERLVDPLKAKIDLPVGTLITDTSYLARAVTATTEAP